MRIIFDSNAFDKMHSSENTLNKISTSDKHEYYITSVQIEEIGNMRDEKREQRIRNLLALCRIRAHLLYTPAIVGHARAGFCVVTNEDDIYKDLLKATGNNIPDAMIGSTAYREGCTVVTDDKRFSNRLKAHSISAMTFDDFMQSL